MSEILPAQHNFHARMSKNVDRALRYLGCFDVEIDLKLSLGRVIRYSATLNSPVTLLLQRACSTEMAFSRTTGILGQVVA